MSFLVVRVTRDWLIDWLIDLERHSNGIIGQWAQGKATRSFEGDSTYIVFPGTTHSVLSSNSSPVFHRYLKLGLPLLLLKAPTSFSTFKVFTGTTHSVLSSNLHPYFPSLPEPRPTSALSKNFYLFLFRNDYLMDLRSNNCRCFPPEIEYQGMLLFQQTYCT